jgi:hypothetical protein
MFAKKAAAEAATWGFPGWREGQRALTTLFITFSCYLTRKTPAAPDIFYQFGKVRQQAEDSRKVLSMYRLNT